MILHAIIGLMGNEDIIKWSNLYNVSSAEKAALLLTRLDPRELRVLSGIELGMSQYEFVPTNVLTKYSGLSAEEAKFWLGELDKKDLLYGQAGSYSGYILNYNGYDLLALNAIVKSDMLQALGKPVGMGKEADVFEAMTPRKEKVAVKFHRLGRVSFRDTRRKRGFIGERRHMSWLYQSRLAAEREYEALKKAYEAGVSVPRPIFQNRHVVVMEFIEGHQLSEVSELDDPEAFLDEILINVKKAYDAGLIHNDLSEFNLMASGEGKIYIIDWPQYISRGDPNAQTVLKKDVANVLRFFSRKFRVSKHIDDVTAFLFQ
jgi:RIO kinase 2